MVKEFERIDSNFKTDSIAIYNLSDAQIKAVDMQLLEACTRGFLKAITDYKEKRKKFGCDELFKKIRSASNKEERVKFLKENQATLDSCSLKDGESLIPAYAMQPCSELYKLIEQAEN